MGANLWYWDWTGTQGFRSITRKLYSKWFSKCINICAFLELISSSLFSFYLQQPKFENGCSPRKRAAWIKSVIDLLPRAFGYPVLQQVADGYNIETDGCSLISSGSLTLCFWSNSKNSLRALLMFFKVETLFARNKSSFVGRKIDN